MRFVIFLFAQFNAEALCPPVLDACAYSFQYSKHHYTAQGRNTASGVPAFSEIGCLANANRASCR